MIGLLRYYSGDLVLDNPELFLLLSYILNCFFFKVRDLQC